MMLRLPFYICLLLLTHIGSAQKGFPSAVQSVINKAGKNGKELKKALLYYKQDGGDSLKFKAVSFLIENMDIHYSQNYYWADSSGRKIAFDELNYPTFDSSLHAFELLKKNYGKLHPVPVKYYDIDTVTAEYLVSNVEQAFKVWPSPITKDISFTDFCEYILPYRISTEPLQDWKGRYKERFQWINDSASGKTAEQALPYLVADYNKWFFNTYNIEARNEPLPRLGSLQLLHRKKGPCEDIADLEVFTLRSQGIPASIDEVSAWATSSGKHFLNVAFNSGMKPVSFDVSTPLVTVNKLNREPAKVLRTTYSKQKDVLAALEKKEDIPDGLLRNFNYTDVTKEYWETKDVSSTLFKIANQPKVAYACVFNFSAWKPVWWGYAKNGTAVFKDMCKGAVFLPMYYSNGKLTPAGYPIASGYNNTLILKPDTLRRHAIHLKAEERYLAFQTGKKYRLFYWNNAWKALGEKTAKAGITELVFDNVPQNALLLLRPEYSQNKERPFIITPDGQRLWW